MNVIYKDGAVILAIKSAGVLSTDGRAECRSC